MSSLLNQELRLATALVQAFNGGALTTEILDAIRPLVTRVREEASKSPAYGFDDSFGLFLRKMYFLNPQSYGGRIQNYFAHRFGYTTVPARLNRGDFKTTSGQFYEFKFSFADFTTPCLNLVQIRLFQDLDGYYCVVSDVRNNFKTYVFRLSKAQMADECSRMGASSAHGTKEAVANNATRELRLSLPVDEASEHFSRWTQQYSDTQRTILLNSELFS